MTGKVNGVLVGTVQAVDNAQSGAVRVQFAWLGGQSITRPAPIATLMAGTNRGLWFMPEVGDEVLVAFQNGNVDEPFIVGFLWNGQHTPPTPADPKIRKIRSYNGHEIEMFDPGSQGGTVTGGDQGYLRISDAHGNKIEMRNTELSIFSPGTVRIDAAHIFINRRRVLLSSGSI